MAWAGMARQGLAWRGMARHGRQGRARPGTARRGTARQGEAGIKVMNEIGSMKLVIVESPYAGDIDANTTYARLCVRDSLERGEAPIASHLLYPQPGILREDIPEERAWGIQAGLAWRKVAELSAFYVDRGWSRGMEAALKVCVDEKRLHVVRRLGDN